MAMVLVNLFAFDALEDARLFAAKGDIALIAGNSEEAIKLYDQALEKHPANHSIILKKAKALRDNLKKTQDSLPYFEKAIEISPENGEYIRERGITFLSLDKTDEALKDFDKAIALNPKDAIALRERGAIFHKKKEFPKAIEDLNKSIEANPDPLSYLVRGLSWAGILKHSEAKADLSKAILLKPDYGVAYAHRGNVNYILNAPDEGSADYKKAAQLDPTLVSLFIVKTGFPDPKDAPGKTEEMKKEVITKEEISPELKSMYVKLARDSENKVSSVRRTAYEAIGALESKGQPLTGVLCTALLERDQRNVPVILDALKKVDPEVYERALEMVVNKQYRKVAEWALKNPKGKCLIGLFTADFFAYPKSMIGPELTADIITMYEPESAIAERVVLQLISIGARSPITKKSGSFFYIECGLNLIPRLPAKKAFVPTLIQISGDLKMSEALRYKAFSYLVDFRDETNSKLINQHLNNHRFDNYKSIRSLVENTLNKQ
jgi:tetratricopeptide (TPR) repeat protein